MKILLEQSLPTPFSPLPRRKLRPPLIVILSWGCPRVEVARCLAASLVSKMPRSLRLGNRSEEVDLSSVGGTGGFPTKTIVRRDVKVIKLGECMIIEWRRTIDGKEVYKGLRLVCEIWNGTPVPGRRACGVFNIRVRQARLFKCWDDLRSLAGA